MEWIFDNFHILAFVGIAMASWLKARSDAKAAERAEREEREAREQRGETEEEIFGPDEDWGEPQPWTQQTQPPPLVVAPAAPPPIPVAVNHAEAELKRQMLLQERLKELRENRAVTSGGATATKSRNASGSVAEATKAAPLKLRGVLRNRSEIRRAVILREVLGPPLSLR